MKEQNQKIVFDPVRDIIYCSQNGTVYTLIWRCVRYVYYYSTPSLARTLGQHALFDSFSGTKK